MLRRNQTARYLSPVIYSALAAAPDPTQCERYLAYRNFFEDDISKQEFPAMKRYTIQPLTHGRRTRGRKVRL